MSIILIWNQSQKLNWTNFGPPSGTTLRATPAHPSPSARRACRAPTRDPNPRKKMVASVEKNGCHRQKKSFGVVYKIINHTRKIEYVIFKEGAHFKKNQNALATKSNCDVYKIVCHLCKSQKPHAKNPGQPFRQPAPLGLGLGCADPPSTGRSQRVVHFWSK